MINPIKSFAQLKLRNKLMLMFIIVIVPVFCAGVYLILSITNVLQSNVVEIAYKEADNLETRIRDTLYVTSNAAERVYTNQIINDFINNDFTENEQYLEFYSDDNTIRDYIQAYSQIEDIVFYIDGKEGFVYNADYQHITERISTSYWYMDAVENETPRWQVIKNQSDGNFYLSYIRQVKYYNGNFAGVMVVYVNPAWIEELMSDEIYYVMFSVKNGMVFYSNIEGFELGKVFSLTEGLPGYGYGTIEIKGKSILTDLGYTVLNYFDYENTGNMFQIYLVKPYSTVNLLTFAASPIIPP